MKQKKEILSKIEELQKALNKTKSVYLYNDYKKAIKKLKRKLKVENDI